MEATIKKSGSLILITAVFSLAVFLLTPVVVFGAEINAEPTLPAISIDNFAVKSVEKGAIKGSFEIANRDQTTGIVYGLSYKISLFKPLTDNPLTPIAKLMDNFRSEDFSLKQNESKTFDFTFNYPINIPPGKYRIEVGAMYLFGGQSESASGEIALQGNNHFVVIDDSNGCNILKQGIKFPVYSEVLLSNGQLALQGQCVVKNLTEKPMTVVPKVFIKSSQNQWRAIKTIEASPITLGPGKDTVVTIDMPSMSDPARYIGDMALYENGEKVSTPVWFRWIVVGETGNIISVSLDHYSYQIGETANVSLLYIGSPDNYWKKNGTTSDPSLKVTSVGSELKDFVFDVSIVDKSTNQICAQKQEMIAESVLYSDKQKNIDLKIDKNCPEPITNVKMVKGDKVLFSFVSEKANKKIEDTILSINVLKKYLLIIFIILLVLIGIFYIKRNKQI